MAFETTKQCKLNDLRIKENQTLLLLFDTFQLLLILSLSKEYNNIHRLPSPIVPADNWFQCPLIVQSDVN